MSELRPPRWLKPMNKVVLRAFPAEAPVGVGFAKRSGLARNGTAEEFESLAGTLSVFRLYPVATG